MRETNFIKQNKQKWKEFEQTLSQIYKDPDKLKDIFIQITDDLSFARTFYPNRSVRVYLNSLAQKIFFNIYKNKKSKRGRIFSFWTDELPHLMWEARKELQLSLFIFLVSVGIGIISCMADHEFVRIILGDQYVEMTKSNIANGDPMAVYKDDGAFGMFLGITANNIFVAFLAFLLGITYVGTIGLLIRNGVMLGSFQFFFVEYDLFWESFLTVWMHGAFEISAIVLAGAAGLTLGKGLIFPGTLSRLKAFQKSAQRGIKIMLGITPIFVAAGFIESYLTRHTEIPDIFRGLFIFMCFAFMIGYFFIYPKWKAKNNAFQRKHEDRLSPEVNRKIDLVEIHTNGGIFNNVFVFYRNNLKSIIFTAALLAATYCLAVFSTTTEPLADLFFFPQTQLNALGPIQVLIMIFSLMFSSSTLWEMGQFFTLETLPYLPIINTLIFGILSFTVIYLLRRSARKEVSEPEEDKKQFKINVSNFFKIIVIAAIFYSMLYVRELSPGWSTFLVFTLTPFLLTWMFVSNWEKTNLFRSFGSTLYLLSGNWWRSLGLFGVLILTGISFFLLLDTVFAIFIFEFIGLNFSFEQSTMDAMAVVILTFMAMFMLYLIFTMILTGFGLLYFTLVEIKEATHLKNKISEIGNQQFIRGLERE